MGAETFCTLLVFRLQDHGDSKRGLRMDSTLWLALENIVCTYVLVRLPGLPSRQISYTALPGRKGSHKILIQKGCPSVICQFLPVSPIVQEVVGFSWCCLALLHCDPLSPLTEAAGSPVSHVSSPQAKCLGPWEMPWTLFIGIFRELGSSFC